MDDGAINVRYRQLRGLVIHYRMGRKRWRDYQRGLGSPEWFDPHVYSRSIILSSTVVPRTIGQKFDGRCRWCRLPVPPKKRAWCGPGCVRAYAMAQGLQKAADGRFLLSTRDACCAGCGLAGKWSHEDRWGSFNLEVDHIVALSIAHERGERERLRAHLLENLQWLCGFCHKEKTADDRRRLANLKAGRAEDWVDPRDTQLELGLMIEGG